MIEISNSLLVRVLKQLRARGFTMDACAEILGRELTTIDGLLKTSATQAFNKAKRTAKRNWNGKGTPSLAAVADAVSAFQKADENTDIADQAPRIRTSARKRSQKPEINERQGHVRLDVDAVWTGARV